MEAKDPDYEYSLQPRVADGVDIDTIKIGPDTPKKTLPIRSRQEANRRVQNGKSFLSDQSSIQAIKTPIQQGPTSTPRVSRVSPTLPSTTMLVQTVSPSMIPAITADWPTSPTPCTMLE